MTSTEKTEAPLTPEQKLENAFTNLNEIKAMLHHMDHRDRLRTIGGFFRSLITLIPTLLLLFSAWYAYHNIDEILTRISQEAAKSAMEMTKGGSNGLLENFKGLVSPKAGETK